MLKVGDPVIVLSGSDRGKTGKILKILHKKVDARGLSQPRVLVEGVNVRKRAVKPTQTRKGGIVEKECPIHLSNIAYALDGKPTRLAAEGTGKAKVRIARKTGKKLAA